MANIDSAKLVRKLLLISILLVNYSSCSIPEDKQGACVLNCDSRYCEYPDLEICECVKDVDCICNNGIKDDDEIVIDCGGVCGLYCCDEENGAEWCGKLTNGLEKTWKMTYLIDRLTGDSLYSGPLYDIIRNYSYSYQVDKFYIEHYSDRREAPFTWEFDNVEQPEKIILEYIGPGEVHLSQGELPIVKITDDTLQLRYINNWFLGDKDMVLVPVD